MDLLLQGNLAWMLYNEAGPRVWHQRLLTAIVEGSTVAIVATPDGDIYPEEMDVHKNADVISIRLQARGSPLPVGVARVETYRFARLPAGAALTALEDEGNRLAAVEGLRLGLPVRVRQDALPIVEDVPRVPPLPTPAPGLTAYPAPPRDVVPIPGRWVVARDEGSHKLGEEVLMKAGIDRVNTDHRKGLHMAFDGEWVFVEKLREGETVTEYKQRHQKDSDSDARVLPVLYNSVGSRLRPWRDVVTKVGQVAFSDWPMPGPRTVEWCCQFVDRRAGGPLEHHRWWMANLRLQPTDFGVTEHEHGMRAFQYFGEYDQLDLTNICGLEVILRRCQLIEYHHEKKSKGQASKEQTAGISRDEAAYFTGLHRLAGEVMICPELVEWVSKEVSRDTEVTKQMRKAREESRLTRGEKP